ncbi:ABC transporter substrate-binding protein [Desulfosarcina alkanivorans]|uniref:ABC transporter substrate-binding protein n=1 Tax=Desulfosarcina alkanivorans TaxID=571177 RepID=A0A5K7YTL3_9BACT|nr:TRAP transporter substrate-binding protein DctP [Desulfosarcina alkanivorans]BBO67997.1 ABC transporter substrate-binding protein [Desulfosarcina alkanivorans]
MNKIKTRLRRAIWLLLAMSVSLPFIPECLGGEKRIKMATYIPVGYPLIDEQQRFFVNQVNETGKGSVRIDMYWGGSLLKGKEILPGLQAGTADMVFQTTAYLLGSFPVIAIQNLPIWDSLEKAHVKLEMDGPLAVFQNDVLRKRNLFQLAVGGAVPEFLWTRRKRVRTPADMRGLKIRVAGKLEAVAMETLGAVPVTMSSAELPQALQRGVVDGALMNPWTARGRGVEEYCRYMLVYALSSQSTPIYVMRNKWESWPAEARSVMKNAAAKWEKNYLTLITKTYPLKETIIPIYEKAGMEAVYPTTVEKAEFARALKPLIDWWVSQVGQETGNRILMLAGVK